MTRFVYCLSLLSILILFSCGHSHEPSETLKRAYRIQEEALTSLKMMEGKLEELQPNNSDVIKQKMDALMQNMIEIEGMDHDHSNCSHGHKKSNLGVTDEQMLQVQQEWQDSVYALKAYFKSQMRED